MMYTLPRNSQVIVYATIGCPICNKLVSASPIRNLKLHNAAGQNPDFHLEAPNGSYRIVVLFFRILSLCPEFERNIIRIILKGYIIYKFLSN